MSALVPVHRKLPALPASRSPRPPRSCLHAQLARGRRLLLAGRARPARFALVGGACGLLQLLFLVLLKRAGLAAIPANVAAYILSAQVNFLLSNRFIWHDRWSSDARRSDLLHRWLSFHASIAGTFVLSQAVFVAARLLLPDVAASALGLAIAAVVNFLVQDRLTFRRAGGSASAQS